MLSWIQRSALLILLRKERATVREMRPVDVEPNLFSYHLEGLQADGYIEKVARGTYRLTTKGQRLVGAFSTATNKQHDFIKTVIVLYAKTPDDRYLVFKWSRQTYIGKVGLLHDHMPLGKSLEAGVASAMQDKLGVLLEPTYMTTVLVKIEHDNELVSHMNSLVYKVPLDDVTLPVTSRNGTAYLAKLSETEDMMDGLGELLRSLEMAAEPAEFTLKY